jgi:hypothetical protein
MNVFELPDFEIVKRYPLRKSDGSQVLESNLPFIFKNAMTMQQLTQLAMKKKLDRGTPSSLKKASGTSIADDVDRNVKYYLFELADHFATGQGVFIRFSFNNRLFVELTQIKNSPTNIGPNNCPHEDNTPLMCVHYIETPSILPDKKLLKYMISCDPRFGASYDVAPEVYDCLKSLLDSNKNLLSAACHEEWQQRYGRQAKLQYSPSFLAPLPRGVEWVKTARVGPSNQRTCNLPECNEGADKTCSKCRSAHYCNADHQKQDWKSHKKVCGKSSEELSTDASNCTSDRTIVVPIKEIEAGSGSIIVSHRANAPATKVTSFPKNIHSADTFIIKAQISLHRSTTDGEFFPGEDGPIIIYDAVRSFVFNLEVGIQPQHQDLFQVVIQNGLLSPTLKCNIKCRGFFYATRESRNIRIFVDRPCPEQSW